ncbi:specifically androgen-regulated gene protein-like [Arapaima gigas]
MPKSDSWPSGAPMDSITSVGSTDSCDSMISVSSAFSEGSLEHLSAEERACLMFLEETIESLEAEDDSGLSNDELECPPTHLPSALDQRSKQDYMLKLPLNIREMEDDKDPGSLFSDIVPPPLVLADVHKLDVISAPPAFAAKADLPQDEVDTSSMHETSSGSQANYAPKSIPLEISLVFVPPPSDFQDEPAEQTAHQVTRQPLANSLLEKLHQRASLKKPTLAKPPSTDPTQQGSALLESHTTHHYDPGEPKTSPPAVAPKPKKLPPNIVMKTHRTSESSGSSPLTSPGERAAMDSQKVRLEALRKLGLLKDVEVDSVPTSSLLHSPKALWCQEAHTPPASPSITRLSPLPSTTPREISEFLSNTSPPSRHSNGTAQPSTKPLVKSASLEQSAVGLSSHMTKQVSSNTFYGGFTAAASHSSSESRPRPVSSGNRHDFISIQGVAHQADTVTNAPDLGEVGKSMFPSAPQQNSGSQKLPRPQGISVLIRPRGDTVSDRQEALRKLGLLKD